MRWLTLAHGQVSHPLDHNEDCPCGAGLLYGLDNTSEEWGDQWTDHPLKRPCRHPVCQALLNAKGAADPQPATGRGESEGSE